MSMEQTIALISAVVTLITVMVSLFTLANTARKDAFEQLKSVVDELKMQLKSANEENERLRKELSERDDKIEEMTQRIDAQDALIAALQAQVDKDTHYSKVE